MYKRNKEKYKLDFMFTRNPVTKCMPSLKRKSNKNKSEYYKSVYNKRITDFQIYQIN